MSAASQPIDQHWQQRCAIFAAFNADQSTFDDERRDRAYWDRIEACESAIINHPDNTPRAVELRLWVAWSHVDKRHDDAVYLGDLPMLRGVAADLDFHERALLTAILNLRGETL